MDQSSFFRSYGRGVFSLGVALTMSSAAWADVQWHFNFKNGNRALIRLLDSGDYRVGFQKQGSSAKKTVKEGKKLKSLQGELDDGSGGIPLSIQVNPPDTTREFAEFSDATDRYFLFPDGSVTKAPPGDWTEVTARLIENNGAVYSVQTYKSALKSRTNITRVSDGRYFDLDSIFHSELEQAQYRVVDGVLSVDGIEGRADLATFKPVPVVTYKGDTFELRSSPTGMSLVRTRDKKSLKLDSKEWKVVAADEFFEIKDGILNVPVEQQRIDLAQFDGEARRRLFLKKGDVVLDDQHKAVDVIADTMNVFTDLVADSRENPEDYPEKIDKGTLDAIAEAVRQRNSAALLGRAGTGKSSAVRAFAREVGLGHVPGLPRTTRILQVKPGNLNSGAQKVGEIDRRVASLISAAQKTGMIIFIDEFHSLKGIGTHSNRETDVTQSFKEPVERGEVVMLTTDTPQEYYRAFGGDPAFDQRFEKIIIESPSDAEVIDRAKAILTYRHETLPEDSVMQAALQMSSEYDVTTRQPRAIVKLLIKAYGRMETHGRAGEPLSLDVLKEAAQLKYKFDPALFDLKKAADRLRTLRADLDGKAIGQSAAKAGIVSLWEMSLANVGNAKQVNSILFAGPSGVGKTKIAEASADLMGYQKTNIEMNKFRRAEDADDFRNELADALQRFPFQVLILDEFEKAHPGVQDAALSILQSGEFTVSGRTNGGQQTLREVNTGRSLFVLTSNAGEAYIRQEMRDGGRVSLKELKQIISAGGVSAHVISRIRQVIPMSLPSREEFKTGVQTFLEKTLEDEGKKRNVTFTFKSLDQIVKEMSETYDDKQSDYRDIEAMMLQIQQIIAHAILTTEFAEGATLELNWDSGETTRKSKPAINMMYL